MSHIFSKNFEGITKDDIQSLLDSNVKENQKIEYKSAMYGRRDDDRREMLRDISSFANAYGGYLIIGISENEDGEPHAIVNIENAEEEKDRIDKSCLANIEPRIPGFKSKIIQMDELTCIIIVFIPYSIKKPHLITFKQLNQFWIRHQDDKMLMSVDEIKEMCITTINILKSVKNFISERENETEEAVGNNSYLIIGSCPLNINDEIIEIKNPDVRNFLIDPQNQTNESYALKFKYGEAIEAYPEPTLSGLKISHQNVGEVNLFRNGYYEIMFPLVRNIVYQNNSNYLFHKRALISTVVNYFRALFYLNEYYGVEESVFSFMNLINIENYILEFGRIVPETRAREPMRRTWEKNNMKIPTIQTNIFNDSDRCAKHFLDIIWNAFGFEEAPYFDNDVYIGKKISQRNG